MALPQSRPAAGTAAGACVHITQPGPAAPPRCAGAIAVTAPGPRQEQHGRTLAPLPGLQIRLPDAQRPWARGSIAEVGCWVWSLHTRRGGGSRQRGTRWLPRERGRAGSGAGAATTICDLSPDGIWGVLMPREALDCQRAALTPVQHRTSSISEHLLPPGVSARLRLVPTSCAFLPASRFLQLHSLSPAARQR